MNNSKRFDEDLALWHVAKQKSFLYQLTGSASLSGPSEKHLLTATIWNISFILHEGFVNHIIKLHFIQYTITNIRGNYDISGISDLIRKRFWGEVQWYDTWVHPKSLSNLSDKQLSTIKPNALSVKVRHQDTSRLCNFFAWLASDKVVW